MSSTGSGKSAYSSRSSGNNIHIGHRERIRERAALEGVEAMQPHELMELLLFYAIPRRDVNALAHQLIDRFGSVGGALRADRAALTSVPGIGARTADFLMSVGELSDAYAELRSEDRPMLGNLKLFRAFVNRVRVGADSEETWQFCLTQEGRLLLAWPIAGNASWAEPEYLRGALDDAISSHAHSVLLAQYVATDGAAPTEYDLEHTERYARALFRLDVRLLDHMIVGRSAVYSMRECGDLGDALPPGEADGLGERYLGPPPTNRSRLREEDGARDWDIPE
ncbi:MAG: RadC family protein [Clostridiales bacterium]|nr:RadC family protein [Clostridiales bacterium]